MYLVYILKNHNEAHPWIVHSWNIALDPRIMNDPSDPSELWASGSLDDWKALVSSYYTRIGEHKVSDHERYSFSLSIHHEVDVV